MVGQIISIIIGAVIAYFVIRIFIKTFKDAKEGKCAGCSKDCNLCDDFEVSNR